MKAFHPVIASNGVPDFYMTLGYRTSEREKNGKAIYLFELIQSCILSSHIFTLISLKCQLLSFLWLWNLALNLSLTTTMILLVNKIFTYNISFYIPLIHHIFNLLCNDYFDFRLLLEHLFSLLLLLCSSIIFIFRLPASHWRIVSLIRFTTEKNSLMFCFVI